MTLSEYQRHIVKQSEGERVPLREYVIKAWRKAQFFFCITSIAIPY